jgi:8-oxo-dGTP pyrophosphatase MutT (NUDIX family)
MSAKPPLPVTLVEVSGVSAKLQPFDWPFARDRRDEIDAIWARRIAAQPKLFNGQVLIQHHAETAHGIHRAAYCFTDYASFVAWRDLGWPGEPMKNGFAMAALRSADGAFLLGRMGAHTVNAGMTYFAAGTPDADDVLPDGTVDLAGSLVRELMEETGLRRDEFTVKDAWTLAMEPFRTAYLRETRVPWRVDEALSIMNARLKDAPDQELSGIVAVRGTDSILHDSTPDFAKVYMAEVFRREGR